MRKAMKKPSRKDKSATRAALRVAAYCRVSTEHEEQASSLDLQEQVYSQRIQATKGWRLVNVYKEYASGMRSDNRDEFLRMMQDCRKNKIDLILTKSFSRFGRNTLDMLKVLRELRELGIDVYFEKENLWLHEERMETMMTVYCAFAQHESENMSKNIRMGIRYGFQKGTSGYANFTCYGYSLGENGSLTIQEQEADVVKQVFAMRSQGQSLGNISDWLSEHNIPSPTGRERWSRETISKLLRNEKYTGDVLLQKTFVKDLFSGKQVKNIGQEQKVLICNHHPGIISRELFAKVSPHIADEIYPPLSLS